MWHRGSIDGIFVNTLQGQRRGGVLQIDFWCRSNDELLEFLANVCVHHELYLGISKYVTNVDDLGSQGTSGDDRPHVGIWWVRKVYSSHIEVT